MSKQPRQASGTPHGGEFASVERPKADVALDVPVARSETWTVETDDGLAVVHVSDSVSLLYPQSPATKRVTLDISPEASYNDISKVVDAALRRKGLTTKREAIQEAKGIIVGHLEDYGDPRFTNRQMGALLNLAIPKCYHPDAYAVGYGVIAGWEAAGRFAEATARQRAGAAQEPAQEPAKVPMSWLDTIQTIDTQHGIAMVYFDDESDPASPGWVLRYNNGTQGNLDEILDVEPDIDQDAAALNAAKRFLEREGIRVD